MVQGFFYYVISYVMTLGDLECNKLVRLLEKNYGNVYSI